jgi:hypothetical protein
MRHRRRRRAEPGPGHEYADIQVPAGQKAPIRFTFFWTAAPHWEGKDFQVAVK